jgi:hypothetical protein
MTSSSPPPLEARRAAWDRLWRILLAPPNDGGPPAPGSHAEPVVDRGEDVTSS